MNNLFPLWDIQAQFDAMIQEKIQRFLGVWLPEVERLMDEKGLDATVYVIAEEPFTLGGPFAHVPKAIITAGVKSEGRPLYPSDEPRRGMTLGIQRMQVYPDPVLAAARIEKDLARTGRPESWFFKEKK